MLNQEINLYRSFEAKPLTGAVLSWKQFCLIAYVISAIFTIGFLHSLWQVYQLDSTLDDLKLQNMTLLKKVDVLKSHYPKDFFTQDTSKSVDQLKSELEKQEQLLNSVVNLTPFSEQFSALARVILPDVWLTNISIIKGGQEISLQGKTIGIENLQNFIKNIFSNKSFANYSLHINNINDADPKKLDDGTFNFELKFVKNT